MWVILYSGLAPVQRGQPWGKIGVGMLNGYEEFKKDVLKLTGIDLSAYREEQMKRRIDTLIARNGINSYTA